MGTIWIVLAIATFLISLSESKIVQGLIYKYLKLDLEHSKSKDVFFYIALLVLITYAGLRSSIGDTGFYMNMFMKVPDTLEGVFKKNDWGYIIFMYGVKQVFTHPQWILVVTSFLSLSAILLTLKKMSPNVLFSVFLFFVLGGYMVLMNGVRQYLVVSLLFSCSFFLLKRKCWILYFLAVAIGTTIHYSALVMIPVFFIVQYKAWGKLTYSVIIIAIIGFLFYSQLLDLIYPILEKTQYSRYYFWIIENTNEGAHPLRFLVSLVPVGLSFIFRKDLEKNLKYYNVYINFSILYSIVLLFSTKHWIYARIGLYFGLYNLILIPAIFMYASDKRLKKYVLPAAIVLYLVFFWFDLRPHHYASYFMNINRDLIGPLTQSFYD